MGILRREPEGLGTREFDDGVADSATSAIFAAPGTAAASSRPVVARNCLRSRAKFLRGFFMRVSSANAAMEQAPMFPPHYTTREGSDKQLNRSSNELEGE